MAADLDACIEYAARNIEYALDNTYGKDKGYSWGQAEVWLRKAELLMRNGASSD